MPKKATEKVRLGFDLENYPIPAAGQPLDVYNEHLQDLRPNESVFSRKLGRISWLQGKILLRAREACRKLGKRGDWGKFLKLTGSQDHKPISPETARLLMKIADQVSEESSRKLKYIEMLRMVYPSFRKELDAVESDEPGRVAGQRPTSDSGKTHRKGKVAAGGSKPPNKRSSQDGAAGGAEPPMTLKEFQQAVQSVLELAQPLGRKKVVLPEDDRAVENVRRIVESIRSELLAPLMPAGKRAAA